MTLRIALRLRGVDLRDTEVFNRICPDLARLSWQVRGDVSLAVFYTDDRPAAAVREAVTWAGHIQRLMPGVHVVEAHDELVSDEDVAARSWVGADVVRAWTARRGRANLRPFPSPRQVIGAVDDKPLLPEGTFPRVPQRRPDRRAAGSGPPLNLYAWREVVTWLREVAGTDPEEGIEYLPDAEHAALNAELAAGAVDPGWHPINIEAEGVITDVEQVLGTRIGMATTGIYGDGRGPHLRFSFE